MGSAGEKRSDKETPHPSRRAPCGIYSLNSSKENNMAAALIPLLAPLIPTITNDIIALITGLVHKAAPIAQANNGPWTGPVKFADVFASTMSDLVKAHAANQITMLPDESIVKLVIQSVVTSMKLKGLLETTALPPSSPAPQSIVLNVGQSIVISVQ